MHPLRKLVNKFSQAVSYLVGIVFFRFFSNMRDNFLQYWSNREGLNGPVRKFIFAALLERLFREYHAPKTPSARREELKRMCISDEAGIKWADYYASLGFQPQDPGEAYITMWRWIEELLKSGEIKNAHQVACSSGREIAYFAKRYPAIEFIGSDLDDKIVNGCRQRWAGIANLKFEVLNLGLLTEEAAKAFFADMVFASAGLTYLDELVLKEFLREIFTLTERLLLAEPLSLDFFIDKHSHSAPRGNFSWNHPYSLYMKESGWFDIEYKIDWKEENYWAKTVSIKGRARARAKN